MSIGTKIILGVTDTIQEEVILSEQKSQAAK